MSVVPDPVIGLLDVLRMQIRAARGRINEDVAPLALRLELNTMLARALDAANGLEAAHGGLVVGCHSGKETAA